MNGIATFNDISLNTVASNYTMAATSGVATAAPATSAFTITAGPASQMVFNSGGTLIVSNNCIGPYQLTLEDAGGNITTNTAGGTINLSVNGSASIYGTSSCGGTLSHATVASSASTSGLYFLYLTLENLTHR